MSTYFRQESLFNLQELYDLEPTQRFASVFSSVSIAPLLGVVGKKTSFGRPIECNYQAMINSLMARIMENMVTIVDTNSQMILHSMMSSGNLNDGKAAIPLLKGINHLFPRHKWFMP